MKNLKIGTKLLITFMLIIILFCATVVTAINGLSTIRSANRIIVVDGNRILEQGTHQELLEKGGEYAQLYNAQKRVV